MLSKKDQDLLIADWSFLSRDQIIRKYQLNGAEVDRIGRKYNLKRRHNIPITSEQESYIRDNLDIPYSELIEKLGLTYCVVYRIKKKYRKKK